jgi:hypothetical protein
MKKTHISGSQILRAIKAATIALFLAQPVSLLAAPPTVSSPHDFMVNSPKSGSYRVVGVAGGSTTDAYLAGPAHTPNQYLITLGAGVDLGHTNSGNNGALISIGEDGGKAAIENDGTLSGYDAGVLTATGTTVNYSNLGTISASSSQSTYAISGDTITSVGNFGSGKILATSDSASAYGIEARLLDAVNNFGLIKAETSGTSDSSYAAGLVADTIHHVENFGRVSGSGYEGLGVYAENLGSVSNLGGLITGTGAFLASASAYGEGCGVLSNRAIDAVSNQARITGSGYRGFGVRGNRIGTLSNTGTITGTGSSSGYGLGVGVLASSGPLAALTNNGKITGSGNYGLGVEGYTIDSLMNSGTIEGKGTGAGYGIYSGGYANVTLDGGTVSGATDAILLDNEPNKVINPKTGAESSIVTINLSATIKGPIVEANGTGTLYLNLVGGTPAEAAIIRGDAGHTSGDVSFGGHEYSWSGLKMVPHVSP